MNDNPDLSVSWGKEDSEETAVTLQMCNGENLTEGNSSRDGAEGMDRRNAEWAEMRAAGTAERKQHRSLGYWLRSLDRWQYHSPKWEVSGGCAMGEG